MLFLGYGKSIQRCGWAESLFLPNEKSISATWMGRKPVFAQREADFSDMDGQKA
jgi:hypothetical protein